MCYMSWCGCKNGKKQVVVNDNCIGCWACVAICEEVFDLNEEWKAFVKCEVDTSKCDCVNDAIWACPVEAIEKV